MTLERRVVVSIDIPAPLATVWEHLRDPHLIRRWYAWDWPGLDEEIRHVFGEQAVEHVRVDDGTTTHTLTWPHLDVLTVTGSVDRPDRTRLQFTRRSHEGLTSFDGVRDEIDERWIAWTQQLRFALTVHPGEDRRTLAVFGLDAGSRQDPLLDRAGLHGARGVPVGGHVHARRPDGTQLGGTLLHKGELQFGVHLHGFAESFLVVMITPAAHHPPHGHIDAILSTYGMDDALFAEVERRWGGWWQTASHPAHRPSVTARG
ncbi:hypothetical protein ACTHAM_001017 [Cellulomonas soli]|uniref:hypothetical protein n=1 Tax=Cellulomonas soli TaxID=931535 RepID=UPI003F83DBD2